jgi:hypothetical protein
MPRVIFAAVTWRKEEKRGEEVRRVRCMRGRLLGISRIRERSVQLVRDVGSDVVRSGRVKVGWEDRLQASHSIARVKCEYICDVRFVLRISAWLRDERVRMLVSRYQDIKVHCEYASRPGGRERNTG